MTKNLIILSGLPGSGKSTVTNGYLKEKYSDAVILENDKLKRKLELGNTKADSKKLAQAREVIVKETLATGQDLILDGVWCNGKARLKMYTLAKENGYNVITFMVTAALETVLERQHTRPIEDKVPEDVILSMAKYFNFPEIGKDCDELYHMSTDDSYDIDEVNKGLESLKHESAFHLESVGTHIKIVSQLISNSNINDAEKDILIDVAKYHDLGKKYTKTKRFGTYAYIGHANISVLEYLNNTNKSGVLNLKDTKEYFIANIINKHMIAHDNKELKFDLTYNELNGLDLVMKFSEFDSLGSIATPIAALSQDSINVKCRKYIFSYNYNPMSYYMGVKKVIEKFNLSEDEVKILVEETLKYFKMRSSIYDIDGNCLAQGLEAFFNVNQFAWIEVEDTNVKEWQKLFIDLSTPVGKTKEYTKVDGSLIQIVNLDGNISVHSRGSFFGELSFINDDNALNKVKNIAKDLLKELNITLEIGDVVYAEIIGKTARIVLDYNVDLKLIPLIHISDGKITRFDTSSSLELNLSDFAEGVVVIDENNTLFKSKTADYFEAHKYLGKLFSENNILDMYINDTLDDFAHLYRTEEEMDLLLLIFKTLDEMFNYKNLNFHECKELDKELEFNLCKHTENFEKLKESYQDELYFYLIGNKEILPDLKMKDKRKLLEVTKNDYLSQFNDDMINDKFNFYKCLASGRGHSPAFKTVKNIITKVIDDSSFDL